jgi:hypothetical protein
MTQGFRFIHFSATTTGRCIVTNSSQVLAQVLNGLSAGSIKVVDLTKPLGEETPIIGLPPEFAQTPAFSRQDNSQ